MPTIDGAPLIKAEDLDIGYSNEVIVANIGFELGPGEAFALIGTNGSGKSTLLKTIVGLLPVMGGQLSVFGIPPGNNHEKIAYLGQFHHGGFVLPLRVIDVVRMGRFPQHGLWKKMGREDDEIVHHAMDRMGIEKLVDAPLRSLSGGQQQRTYLAQVLAHQASLLVLDEPTSGLDAGGRELYLHALNDELCRGASVIIATHNIHDEAALCRQVMLLARKVVAFGAPEQVITPEALLETFGIAVTGEKTLQVFECQRRDDTERLGPNMPRR
ncbi:MAG: ATP-binding cassette domain-containing protein [Chloroflexota bacterium]